MNTGTRTPLPGPLGALIDETAKAVDRFLAPLQDLDDAAFDVPRETAGGLRSVRAVDNDRSNDWNPTARGHAIDLWPSLEPESAQGSSTEHARTP